MALSFAVFKNGSAASVEMIRSLTWRRLIENPQPWVLAACAAVLLFLFGNEIWITSHALFYRPAVAAASTPSRDVSRASIEHIIGAELFGRAPAQSAGNQTPPETSLQLTLRGVFTADDPHRASAMIESSDGHAQIVKAGANVAADTVLQQVFSNRVVLMRNGIPESLYFPAPPTNAGESSVAQNDVVPGADAPVSVDDHPAASPEELKRAAILRRLEELRARSSH